MPTLRQMIVHPAFAKFFALPLDPVDNDGKAGLNRGNYNIIEEQRRGVDWIVHGLVAGREDWCRVGWRVLDFGISQQASDGGFGSKGYLHSNALFIEALARACILIPSEATGGRLEAIRRGAEWLMKPTARDLAINRPYTHRRYILAATLGQSAVAAHLPAARDAAYAWAREGLSLQRRDGVNPEAGGFDLNYQMVGPLHAARYMASCPDVALRDQLRRMMRRAGAWEIARISDGGSVDPTGSTRIGHEAFGGRVKGVNYYDLFEALVYGAQLVDSAWLNAASRIGRSRGWWPAS